MKKNIIISAMIIVSISLVGIFIYPKLFPSKPERRILYWTDPMIPGDRSDHPGKSPMGMERTPVYEDETKSEVTTNAATSEESYYTCPMHPSVKSDKPGACPVCGMALVKKSVQKETSSDEKRNLSTVSLSHTQRVIANVSTTAVLRKSIQVKINSVGVVDYAEPLQAKVTARFRGRIEKLFVNFTGEVVKKGQPLFELYSPDLLSAQQELILALSAITDIQNNLLQASRDRLRIHFGLTEDQIIDIERTKQLKSSITYFSPISGTVISKDIQEGQYIDEGMLLYQLADLSKVWIYLDIYEKDLPFVKIGQSVTIRTEALPDQELSGVVQFIDPTINPETRTVRIRTECKNPEGMLKPQMYVKTEIAYGKQNVIVVPTSAILTTGKRTVAWVEIKENVFEPRNVVVGLQSDDEVEILSGLEVGENIVTSGGYLIESESQLQQPVKEISKSAGHEGMKM